MCIIIWENMLEIEMQYQEANIILKLKSIGTND